MTKRSLPLLIPLFLASGSPAQPTSPTNPQPPSHLRTEHAENPLTIDVAHPRLSWFLPSTTQSQSAYQLQFGATPDSHDLLDTGKVASGESLNIASPAAATESSRRTYWRVRTWNEHDEPSAWSAPAFFETSLLTPSEWSPAQWITANQDAPLLRKSFTLAKPVLSARAYVCGLGYHELYLNNAKVSDHLLSPAQTDYESRALYETHDVTPLLHQGVNAVGLMLGTGWFDQHVVWGGMSYGRPCATLKILVTHPDRTTTTIVTDPAWKTHPSPITSNNLYAGESYDARLELPGWSSAAFNDQDWQLAQAVPSPTKTLESAKLPPIKITSTLDPIKVTQLKPDLFIYDFGTNNAAIPLLTTTAPAGTKYTLRFAEALHPDGSLDPASTGTFATTVVQTDTYTANGSPQEIYSPHFTYHGYRYVELTGPKPASLRAQLLHTAVEPTSSFECSDPSLNRIHEMALRTYLSNLHGLPTDCPARERNGWLGDAHGTAELAMLNFDTSTFYPKYLRDVETSRRGQLPGDVAPGKRITAPNGNTDWGAAIVMLPYFQYLYYADLATAEEHYPAMQQYIAGVDALAQDGIVSKGYGDWCPPGDVYPPKDSVPLTTTAWFFRTTTCMATLADALNHPEDAARYRALADRTRAAFNKHYYTPATHSYGSQTANTIALAWHLAPKEDEQLIADALYQDVMVTHHAHHTTGILGSRYLHQTLAAYHHEDAALALLHQTTYPSIGHNISLGATTFWENWSEPDIDAKYGARSLNHPMQASLDAGFFQSILGITPDPKYPAFKHTTLHPHFLNSLTFAHGHISTPYGPLVSDWHSNPTTHTFTWHLEIPANTTATALLPDGRSIDLSPGTHVLTSPLP